MSNIDGDSQYKNLQLSRNENPGFIENARTVGGRFVDLVRKQFARFGKIDQENGSRSIEMSAEFDDNTKLVAISLYQGKEEIAVTLDFSQKQRVDAIYDTFYYNGPKQYEAFKKMWASKDTIFSSNELELSLDDLKDLNAKLISAGIANFMHVRGREYGVIEVVATENTRTGKLEAEEQVGVQSFETFVDDIYLYTDSTRPLVKGVDRSTEINFINYHHKNQREAQDGVILVTRELDFLFREASDYLGQDGDTITFVESLKGGAVDQIKYANGKEILLENKIAQILLYNLMVRRNTPLRMEVLLGPEAGKIKAYSEDSNPKSNGGVTENDFRQALSFFESNSAEDFFGKVINGIQNILDIEKPQQLKIVLSEEQMDWDLDTTIALNTTSPSI